MTRVCPTSGWARTAAALLAAGIALGGCEPVSMAVGAGAVATYGAAQERGLKQAAVDTRIKVGISERLLQKSVDLFGKVSVAVVEGRVLLTGAVRSDADKDEATKLAWPSDGVREVINEIQVTSGGDLGDVGGDTKITAKLRFLLIGDRYVSDINYSIETVNGVIYLIGIAQDQNEINRVTDHARTIGGVRRVVSHVLTKDDPRRQKPS
jgi:osmotically-inducible protein OsmY